MLMGLLVVLLSAGCSSGREQPKVTPLEPSDVFPNYQSARPLPANVVARPDNGGSTRAIVTQSDTLTTTIPITLSPSVEVDVTQEMSARGEEQYSIYCAPCHGATGAGDGPVVARGFPPPPSLRREAVRTAPPSYIYDVITNGRGTMFSYAARVAPEDRWAIAAYIRTFQGSDEGQ